MRKVEQTNFEDSDAKTRDSKLLLRCSLIGMLERVEARPARCDGGDGMRTREESLAVERVEDGVGVAGFESG